LIRFRHIFKLVTGVMKMIS